MVVKDPLFNGDSTLSETQALAKCVTKRLTLVVHEDRATDPTHSAENVDVICLKNDTIEQVDARDRLSHPCMDTNELSGDIQNNIGVKTICPHQTYYRDEKTSNFYLPFR